MSSNNCAVDHFIRHEFEGRALLEFLQLYRDGTSHFHCLACGEWSEKSKGSFRHKSNCATKTATFSHLFELCPPAKYRCKNCDQTGFIGHPIWHEFSCPFYRYGYHHNQYGIYTVNFKDETNDGINFALDYARAMHREVKRLTREIGELKCKLDSLLNSDSAEVWPVDNAVGEKQTGVALD